MQSFNVNIQLPSLKGEQMDYTAVCLSALNRVPRWLRRTLAKEGGWYDVRMWAFTAAVEAHFHKLNCKDAYNLAQQYIYAALKAEGWRRTTKGSRVSFRSEKWWSILENEDVYI